ncbi:MAG TPA: M20/M25/M40 family metallo-hydrolase [Candidatus Limnocylindrales bacterium]
MERPTRRALLTATALTASATPLLAGASFAEDPEIDAAGGPGRLIKPQQPERALRETLEKIDPRRIEATITRLVQFGTRHTLSSQDDPVRGIGAATEWVYQQMLAIAETSGGRMTVEKQTFIQPVSPRIPTPTPITNVIATLRGDVEPQRYYVVTGHLDSRVTDVMNFTSDAPGADDDGSGVAVVLEMARLLATQHFRGTLVFATVTGEEQGLYGSAFMATQMKNAAIDVQGMFSNDIVGASSAWDGTRPDPRTVRLFVEGVPTTETPQQAATRQSVGGENDGPSRQLGRFVKNVAENDHTGMRVRLIWRRDRYLRGSDHISFIRQSYPAARFTEPRENYNHEHQDVRVVDGVQFGDLAEFCDFGYIARVAKVNIATMWSLAAGPGTPKNVRIAASALTNDTTLTWTVDPAAATYEVVWRETTAPDWTHAIDVGTTGAVTIDMVKDNFQFGLRAVDADRRHSPVAFPTP